MECSDLVEEYQMLEQACNEKYDECQGLYDKGMIYAAHKLMLQNIDNCCDLGVGQNTLCAAIKQEHTFLVHKSAQVLMEKSAKTWTECVLFEKRKGVDCVKICVSTKSATTFLIDVQLDAGLAHSIALALRLEFADTWLSSISTCSLVKQLLGHSHIVSVTVANPISSFLGGRVLFVRVDTYDNILFNEHYIVIITPLSTKECR